MRSLTVILGCLAVAATCPAQTPIWTEIKPTTSPSARARHSMVYDSARQRTVLFGGGLSLTLGDTWEWDGRRWSQLNPTNSPPARRNFAMAYDSVRQRTVLFAGTGGQSALLGDTWEWDGGNWKQISPPSSPPPRAYHTMAFDPVRQRTVLFGGTTNGDGSGTLRDTWEFDGMNWKQIKPPASPPARAVHGMSYDSARCRTVLFGGMGYTSGKNTYLNDTWEYDGTKWTQSTPSVSPPARWWAVTAYDSARQRTVLLGGAFPASKYLAGR